MTYVVSYREAPRPEWRDPDPSILDDKRAPVPAVPLEHVPQPWRDWIADTERATGAPADYVLASVLAAVAGVCGAGVRITVTPAWSEPLILWQSVVGGPSTGKTAALAPMRRLLDAVEQERRLGDEARRVAHAERFDKGGEVMPFVPSQIVASEAGPLALADIVAGNPRGVLLWRDSPSAWVGDAAPDRDEGAHAARFAAWEGGPVTLSRSRQPARSPARFAVSLLVTVRPERLQEALRAGDDSLAERFLYAWPGPQPCRALAVVDDAHDATILQRLRALSRLAASPDDPCTIGFDGRGRAALDGVLAGLHAEHQKVEGLEAAWLGRSRSFIVRLAGMLELLALIDGKVVRPGAIGAEQVAAAAMLWRDYYWPHARAVLDRAELSEHGRHVRRVARWLRDKAPKSVSREDIRRRALSQAATADETEQVLQRLHDLGYVQPDPAYRDRRGRPSSHWLVNPALAEDEKAVAQLA